MRYNDFYGITDAFHPLVSVWVGFFLTSKERKKSAITASFPFIPWRLMKIDLYININEKCEVGDSVLINHNTEDFQKLYLNKGDCIWSDFRKGGKPSLLETFSCVLIAETEDSFYLLKEAEYYTWSILHRI